MDFCSLNIYSVMQGWVRRGGSSCVIEAGFTSKNNCLEVTCVGLRFLAVGFFLIVQVKRSYILRLKLK